MAFIWDKNTGKIGPALVKVSSSPSYTIDEIKQLARESVEQSDTTNDDKIIMRLVLSRFLAWLAKREQGKESER